MMMRKLFLFRHRWRSSGLRYLATSFVPPPTWSIAELGLQEQHESASIDMEVLCRRACLEPQPDLSQDVANMMHMLKQVTNASSSRAQNALSQQEEDTLEGDDEAAAAIYDRPRGVTAAPVLSGPPSNAEPKEWLETLQKTKMKRVGGHYYFEMKIRSSSNENDDQSQEESN